MKALLIALTFLIVLSGSASASKGWCRSDPIVQIGDTTYQLEIWLSESRAELNNGPLEWVFYYPEGLSTSVIFTDNGFGYGENISFVAVPGATSVYATLYFPATRRALFDIYYNQVQYDQPPDQRFVTNVLITLPL